MQGKTRFTQLKAEARQSATWRGHKIGRFIKFAQRQPDRFVADAYCENCDMYVAVDTHPALNGIEVGGPAVGLNCTKGA
jgi:hypothetical protein